MLLKLYVSEPIFDMIYNVKLNFILTIITPTYTYSDRALKGKDYCLKERNLMVGACPSFFVSVHTSICPRRT